MEEFGFTTVQAVAELLKGRMEPAMRDGGVFEFEDICDMVRNAYASILFAIYMQNMADGDRTALESLLQKKYIPVEHSTSEITLEGMMVVDLPRDAGLYSVIAADAHKKFLSPLTKTTPAGASSPKSKIDPGKRYYRIGREINFPDGLPDCTAFVLIIFYGLDTTLPEEKLPRDYADMAYEKVLNKLFPTKQITADITNNGNPNM